MDGADELRWSRRVKPEKIRRLYALDAKGIIDDELLDDVGYAMLARCESIRTATRAHAGRATCPRCKAQVVHEWDKAQALMCGCGWSSTWGAYLKSYQGKQLHGGQAYPMFRDFIERWPGARTSRDKMLAIDALIHACHGQFKGAAGRPAACNLIEGTARELIAFLDQLAYGDGSTAGVTETREQWQAAVDASWMRRWRPGSGGGD
jgi:hypothetical protein